MGLLKQFNALIWSWSETLRAFRHGVAVAPFAIYTSIHLVLLLGIVWFAYPPMSSIVAPLLRWRVGEMALHYPGNLFALRPALAQADSVLIVFLGSVLTGAAVHMFASFYGGRRERLGAGWAAAVRRYVPLAVVAGVLMLATHFVAQAPFAFMSGLAEDSPGVFRLFRLAAIAIVVVIQALFVYTTPYLVASGRSLMSSVRGSFRLAAVTPVTTLFIVGVPAALELIPLWLTRQSATIAMTMAPEFLIWIMVLWVAIIFVGGYLAAGAATRFFLHSTQDDAATEGGGRS